MHSTPFRLRAGIDSDTVGNYGIIALILAIYAMYVEHANLSVDSR